MSKSTTRAVTSGPNAGKWVEAKRLCQLSTRQVEMARALGMNPKKLPGLRPNKSQRWKGPVGEFIEECYAKRFGDPSSSKRNARSSPPNGRKTTNTAGDKGTQRCETRLLAAPGSLHPPGAVSKGASADRQSPSFQAMDLLAYLVNLADDLEATLAAAAVTPELLASLNTELHEVATKLTAGDSIPQLSEIEGLVVREETCLDEHERAWLDDKDAPF